MAPNLNGHVASSNSDNAVGIASQEYARRVKHLIKLMTDLRAMGAQTDIDLPRIAVIGNQSAGKSSLVEAISGITVPRASGTCTRCPMECRLTYSPHPWKTQVFLRLEVDENGEPLPVKEEKFGPIIHDKTQLEDMLKRAQMAILNPSVAASQFVDCDPSWLSSRTPPLSSSRQLQFSANVVCLDISGPEVTDLSFIDLPGIISNVADGEDRNNIDLVKNLVKRHIAGNALILLTITMRDDIENQSAAYLAKEADPKGHRTIGVLTKPDTLQDGEEDMWLEVLEGRRHPLLHGYYVTKQPATSELTEKLEHSIARERERDFFHANAPWKSATTSVRHRMGVPNLTKELSRLLSQLIEKLLPKLRSDSRASLTDTLKALDALPPRPSENPSAQLLQLVTAFTRDVDSYIIGTESSEDLIQKCRAAYVAFQRDIIRTEPRFSPLANAPATDLLPYAEDESTSSDSSFESSTLYLDEVRDYIAKSLTRQLPFNIPFSAKVGLIERCFQDWPDLARCCFNSVYKAFEDRLEVLVAARFDQFTRGSLLDHIRAIVERQLKEAQKNTTERIKWLLEMENTPFTLNDHYFSSYREKYLARYKEQRLGHVRTSDNTAEADALSALARLGFQALTAEDLQKLHGPDPYEQELICIAEVRAYFQVAYKRIIDNLPRIIDYDFLRALGRGLQQALYDELGLSGNDAPQRAMSYLSEDPDVVAQREDLSQTKERLEEILDKLFRFNSKDDASA